VVTLHDGFRGHHTGFRGSGDTILISNIVTPFGTRPRATIRDLVDRAPLTQTHRGQITRAIRGKMRSFNRSGTNRTFLSERETEFSILQSVPKVGLEPTPACEDRILSSKSFIVIGRRVARSGRNWPYFGLTEGRRRGRTDYRLTRDRRPGGWNSGRPERWPTSAIGCLCGVRFGLA
jgi:hypothetical protein